MLVVRRQRKKRLYKRKRPSQGYAPRDPLQHRVTRVGTIRKARKMATAKRHARCSTCTSFFPKKNGSHECLSGMPGSDGCEEYEFAIFQLVPNWTYSVAQVMWMRKAEENMKRAEGKEDL